MATGIGSLPFEDPRPALELILTELPECPHWPQLPRRSRREHFVHQFLQPLVACGLLVHQNGRWFFDLSRDTSADSFTLIYSACLAAEEGDAGALRSFLPPPEAAAGFHAFMSRAETDDLLRKTAFVKGQIAGPLTVALEMKDEGGRPAYYQGDLRDVIVRTLALNARSQAAALSRAGSRPIIFVDDPAVSACGSRMHLTLDRDTILEDLNLIFAAIRAEGALAGVHSCEAADWSLLTESSADIVSIDTYRFGSSLIPYAAPLHRFFERGGAVAWGIAPTLDDPFAESAESLMQRLYRLWEDLDFDEATRKRMLQQSMITPACGVGLLSEAQARQIYRLTADVSRRMGELAPPRA
jgi:hypothetical protein